MMPRKVVEESAETRNALRATSRAAKKKASRARPRVSLTHLEVKRGVALRMRIAIADDAFAEVGDELGALLKKLAPQTSVVPAVPEETTSQFVISRQHAENDADYHAGVREHLAELIGALCDESLEDVLAIAREERARRSEGGN